MRRLTFITNQSRKSWIGVGFEAYLWYESCMLQVLSDSRLVREVQRLRHVLGMLRDLELQFLVI